MIINSTDKEIESYSFKRFPFKTLLYNQTMITKTKPILVMVLANLLVAKRYKKKMYKKVTSITK